MSCLEECRIVKQLGSFNSWVVGQQDAKYLCRDVERAGYDGQGVEKVEDKLVYVG